MGHYDDCFEAGKEERDRKENGALRAAIEKELGDMDNDELSIILKIAVNRKIIKSFLKFVDNLIDRRNYEC